MCHQFLLITDHSRWFYDSCRKGQKILHWISFISHILRLLFCRLHREHLICFHQMWTRFSAHTHDDGVSVTIASSICHFVQSLTLFSFRLHLFPIPHWWRWFQICFVLTRLPGKYMIFHPSSFIRRIYVLSEGILSVCSTWSHISAPPLMFTLCFEGLL